MKCEVCGQDYGVAHNCAGVAAAPDSEVAPPPAGFALGHYLAEAFRIATWNDGAIRRTMNDPRALGYGICIYLAAVLVSHGVLLMLAVSWGTTLTAQAILGLSVALVFSIIFDFAKIGICHLLAKWFSGGSGTYIQLLRPLLLGSIVYVLFFLPVVGFFAAGLAYLCIFVMVFQEVHDMEGLTAFLYSAAVNVSVLIVQISLMPSHQHF